MALVVLKQKDMKKLIPIILILTGCVKSDYCVECSKEFEDPVVMCSVSDPNISEHTYLLNSQGWECYRY